MSKHRIILTLVLFSLVLGAVMEPALADTINYYYPDNYTLYGSTKLVSGILSALQSDDSSYMIFSSYVNQTSTTANTQAFIAYRDNAATSIPYNRTWSGSAWGSAATLPTAGSVINFVRVAYCPIEQRSLEKIVVTCSTDGYLDAYVWDGSSWTTTNNIANVGVTANIYKCFDVAYEKNTGDALLTYSIAPATNLKIGYKTWSFVNGWSSEYTYQISSGTAYTTYWISAASKPTSGSNEIAVGVLSSGPCYGLIWTGDSFYSQQLLTSAPSITTEECIAVAYEQTSGYATFVSSTGNNAFSWQWSGSAWDGVSTLCDLTGSSTPNWLTLKADPASGSDKLFVVSVDGATDLNTAEWSGSAWTLHTETDAAVDTHASRCADFAWESTGSKGLLVWGTASAVINWKSYTYPNTWPGSGAPAMDGTVTHPWVQLRTNPRSVSGDMKVLGAVLDTSFKIGAIKWDGSAFTVIGANTISGSAGQSTYECYEMEYQNFGPPTQFASQVEFTGTSDTGSWSQLNWTINSAFSVAGVSATLQLWNYTRGGYPSSGSGYMSDTIGISDVTKTQVISTNPTQFRDGSGNWKMKITGVLSTSSLFLWKGDLVLYKTTTSSNLFTRTANATEAMGASASRVVTNIRSASVSETMGGSASRVFIGTRSASASEALVSSANRIFIGIRTASASEAMESSADRTYIIIRGSSATITLSSTASRQQNAVRAGIATISVTTSAGRLFVGTRTATATISPSSSAGRVWTAVRSASASISVSSQAGRIYIAVRGGSAIIQIGSSASRHYLALRSASVPIYIATSTAASGGAASFDLSINAINPSPIVKSASNFASGTVTFDIHNYGIGQDVTLKYNITDPTLTLVYSDTLVTYVSSDKEVSDSFSFYTPLTGTFNLSVLIDLSQPPEPSAAQTFAVQSAGGQDAGAGGALVSAELLEVSLVGTPYSFPNLIDSIFSRSTVTYGYSITNNMSIPIDFTTHVIVRLNDIVVATKDVQVYVRVGQTRALEDSVEVPVNLWDAIDWVKSKAGLQPLNRQYRLEFSASFAEFGRTYTSSSVSMAFGLDYIWTWVMTLIAIIFIAWLIYKILT